MGGSCQVQGFKQWEVVHRGVYVRFNSEFTRIIGSLDVYSVPHYRTSATAHASPEMVTTA